MDLKLPSSEDSFDKAVKMLQLSNLGCESQNVVQLVSSTDQSSGYNNVPDVIKNNKKLYDKIFKEVVSIMKEEEEYGLIPVFSDMFDSNFSQVTYSQFAKGVTRASTQNEFEKNEKQNYLYEQNKNCFLSNKLYSKAGGPETLLKDDKTVHLSNAKLCRNAKDESVKPSCSKVSFFGEKTNPDRHASTFAGGFIRSSVNIRQSSNKFSTDVSCVRKGKSCNRNFEVVSIQNSLVHSNVVLARNNIFEETNFKTTTDRCVVNYDKSNSEIVSDKVCTSYVDHLSDASYSNKTIAKLEGTLQHRNNEDMKVFHTGDVKCKSFKRIIHYSQNKSGDVNSELRVIIDTPLVEKYTPLDVLEKKLIEFYNKRTPQNVISKSQKGIRFRKQKAKDSTLNKPAVVNEVKRTDIGSAKVVKSHDNNELQLLNCDITDISGSNNINYDLYKNHNYHSEQRIQLQDRFCKLNGRNKVAAPIKYGSDSSMTMHLMYDALQVGCIKSSGFVRNVVPSLQNDIREDAVQFNCKSCLTEYSYQEVKSSLNLDSLTCFCPKELRLGLYTVLVAEFFFKFFVEDLSKSSFIYILAGKEAETFFGCTVHDFWHSSDSRRVVRRSIRNLLRSYKRKILSEFCLSTRNLFGCGPKYLINVSRQTCIAPIASGIS